MFEVLKYYKPRKDSKYYKLKDDLLINAQNFYDGRKMIIEAFKTKIFPLSNPDYYPEYTSEKDTLSRSSISSDSEDISPRGATAASPRSSLDSSRSSSPINNESIDPKTIKHYFGFSSLNKIYKSLNEDSIDKGSNATTIDQALINLKTNIKKLSKEGKQTAQLRLLPNS